MKEREGARGVMGFELEAVIKVNNKLNLLQSHIVLCRVAVYLRALMIVNVNCAIFCPEDRDV